MPAPYNLSFEDAGSGGMPDGWVSVAQQTPEEIRAFGAWPFETFDEGWDSNEADLTAFAFSDLTAYGFGTLSATPKTAENFDELWSTNQDDLFTLEGPEPFAFQGPRIGTYPSPTTPIAIPDNTPAGVVDSVTVGSDPGGIAKIAVYLDITHPYRGDLRVTLTDPTPSGTSGNVLDQDGGSADNVIEEVDVTADFPTPTVVGVWALTVEDVAAVDEGTLNAWELRFYGPAVGVETFDANWDGNEAHATDFDAVASSALPIETFDTGWYANETDATDWAGVASTAHTFGGGTGGAEGFESVWAARSFALNSATGVFTVPAHGLVDGDLVMFRPADEGSALPSGLNETDLYVLQNTTAGTFTVITIYGDPVPIDDAGQGTSLVIRDVASWWYEQPTTF